MTPITNADLKVDMIVVMVRAGAAFPGLQGLMFKVMEIDDPYVILRTTDLVATTHCVLLSECAFSVPSEKSVSLLAHADYWPDVIG